MHHPTAQFPDRYYLDGLLVADAAVLTQIYNEFRPAILRAVSAAGGSVADGAVFFQLAVLEASALERSGRWPAPVPFFIQLRALALQHYADWLEERGQSMASNQTSPAEGEEEEPREVEPLALPVETLRRTRHKIFAWKSLDRLDPNCRAALLPPDGDGAERPANAAESACLEQWRGLLFVGAAPADSTAAPLPDWAEAARQDGEGYRLWHTVDALERRIASGEAIAAPPGRNRRVIGVLAVVFVALIGWGLYQWFTAAKSPGAVYRENFTLPTSILGDMDARYAADTSGNVVERPLECDALFLEADRLYRWDPLESTCRHASLSIL